MGKQKQDGIIWCHFSWNPWVGCTKVSPACDHCYAEGWAKRSGMVQWGADAERRRTSENNWKQPSKWNAEAERLGTQYRVFSASLADIFDNEVPEQWRADFWALVRECSNLTFLIVTKRIGNAKNMLPADWGDGYPNVWLGATVCNQMEADRDIQKLLAVPAVVRFLSIEPLLGEINLRQNLPDERMLLWYRPMIGMLDWIIVGGESGHGARPMHPDWVRSLRDQCGSAKKPFFFKQWGEWLPDSQSRRVMSDDEAMKYPCISLDCHEEGHSAFKVGKAKSGRLLDGKEWNEYPDIKGT